MSPFPRRPSAHAVLQRGWRALPDPARAALDPAKRAYLRRRPHPGLDQAARWDKEWIAYLRDSPQYLQDCSTPSDDVTRRIERVNAARGRRFDGERGPVADENPIWKLWSICCHPDEIAGRAVAELGCGAGAAGRTLGYIADTYVGIDYSPLALHLATVTSPPSCIYVPRTARRALRRLAGSIDTAFSRYVFIHQNFDQAVELAGLAAGLLRRGGVLAVDYRLPETDDEGNYPKPPRPAKGPLLTHYPSVSFYFTDDEIAEVGDRAGLSLESIIEVPERSWRLARYRG